MTEQDAYAKTDRFPPYMARALRYALENSDRESLQELAAELVAYPIPEGAPVQSHPLGALNADGSVTTQLPAATQTAEQARQGEIRALTAQRDDAQRAGLKFVAQLNEIREVLSEGFRTKHEGELDADPFEWTAVQLNRIRAILDRPGSPVTETTKQHGDRVRQLVEASLEHDYTVDHDCPEYANDDEEFAAAVANIVEMHRLLNVRAGRLMDAHEEIAKLRALSGDTTEPEKR